MMFFNASSQPFEISCEKGVNLLDADEDTTLSIDWYKNTANHGLKDYHAKTLDCAPLDYIIPSPCCRRLTKS